MLSDNNSDWSVFLATCKDCGAEFSYSAAAMFTEIARGFSAPTRCPSCRKEIKKQIDRSGTCYWYPEVETNPAARERARKQGKIGLMKISSNPNAPQELQYAGVPSADIAAKFAAFDVVVERLIRNLEDPAGARVSILVGPTGSGKSVWASYRMLRSRIGREGKICVSQPRLITLRAQSDGSDRNTTPGFIAHQLLQAPGVGAGHEVGYRYRGEPDKQDKYTRLMFVTDGLLIRWILSGEIGKYSVVMVDEAHEQSGNMELIFALLREKLHLYPRLRVVIASATVDIHRFQAFFGDGNPEKVFVAAPDDAGSSTPFAIHDRFPDGADGYARLLPGFMLPKKAEDCPRAVAQIVQAIRSRPGFTLLNNSQGDILAFLPTIGLIRATALEIGRLGLSDLEVLPCYADCPPDEYDDFRLSEQRAEQAFREKRNTRPQRVILATNYAETSVTLSNLAYVIDSGWIMQPEWNPKSSSMDYPTRRHSRAGCTQRKGRVGRVQPGEMFRLYSTVEFADPNVFPAEVLPEIARTPLDKFLLTAKAAGIDDIESFRWLGYDDRPLQQQERARAIAELRRSGALDNDGDLTARGVELEGFEPKFVDHASLLSESDAFGCSLEIATLLAFVAAGRKVFLDGEREAIAYDRWRKGCYDDLEFFLRIYSHWEKAGRDGVAAQRQWSRTNGFNQTILRTVCKLRQEMLRPLTRRTHTDPTARELDLARLHRARLVAARAMFHWLYVEEKRVCEPSLFRPYSGNCPCPDTVVLDRDSSCGPESGLAAFVCLGRELRGTMLFAKYIIRVEPDWIPNLQSEGLAAAALKTRAEYERDSLRSSASKDAVENLPDYSLETRFAIGKVYDLTLVRAMGTVGRSNRPLVLAKTNKGDPVLLLTDTIADLLPGSSFLVKILAMDSTTSMVTGGRQAVVDGIAVGRILPGTIVKEIKRKDRKVYQSERTGFIVEIFPGIRGFLSIYDYGRVYGDGAFLKVGARLPHVQVIRRDSRGIRLAAPEQGEMVPGTTYPAIVVRSLDSSTTGRCAVLVEFAPFVEGIVLRESFPPDIWEAVGYHDSINVTLVGRTENSRRWAFRYELRFHSVIAISRLRR
jgi:HrpA-like RNA helicase